MAEQIPDDAFTAMLNGSICGIPVIRWDDEARSLELDASVITPRTQVRAAPAVDRIFLDGDMACAFAGTAPVPIAPTFELGLRLADDSYSAVFVASPLLVTDAGSVSMGRQDTGVWSIDRGRIVGKLADLPKTFLHRFRIECCRRVLDTWADDQRYDCGRLMLEAAEEVDGDKFAEAVALIAGQIRSSHGRELHHLTVLRRVWSFVESTTIKEVQTGPLLKWCPTFVELIAAGGGRSGWHRGQREHVEEEWQYRLFSRMYSEYVAALP